MTAKADDAGRRAILDAIRRNLAASASFDAAHQAMESPRRSSTDAPASHDDASGSPLDRFRTALEGVGGRLLIAADETEAAGAVHDLLAEAGVRRVAISDSPLVERVVGSASLDGVAVQRSQEPASLFECDAGITGAQWAIAETGTLVLDSDRERHRLASLVPPMHVAIVEAGVIRETLAEVLAEVGAGGADGLCRTLTLVTGPSRTSDIELTLAIGVHGPAVLAVVVVGGDRHV